VSEAWGHNRLGGALADEQRGLAARYSVTFEYSLTHLDLAAISLANKGDWLPTI
jgi:hypothetical protein